MKFKKTREENLTENYLELHYRTMDAEAREVERLLGSRSLLLGKRENESRLIAPEDVFYLEVVDRRLYVYLEKEVWQLDGKPAGGRGCLWQIWTDPDDKVDGSQYRKDKKHYE